MAEPLAKADCCWEEHGYRTLINNELKRQERPITFLVQPLGRSRSYVSRVLSGQNKLTQELREKAFVALGIDPIRAEYLGRMAQGCRPVSRHGITDCP